MSASVPFLEAGVPRHPKHSVGLGLSRVSAHSWQFPYPSTLHSLQIGWLRRRELQDRPVARDEG